MNIPLDMSFGWVSILTYAGMAISFLVHFFFACAVARDASHLEQRGVKVFFGGSFIWFFATLFGGLLGVAVYWLINHSSLRSPTPPWERMPQ